LYSRRVTPKKWLVLLLKFCSEFPEANQMSDTDKQGANTKISKKSTPNNGVYIKIGDYQVGCPAWLMVLFLIAGAGVIALLVYRGDVRRDLVCVLSNVEAQCTIYKDTQVTTNTREQSNIEQAIVIPKPVVCRVNNPTGKPINLRPKPNIGDIGDVPNDTDVSILGIKTDSQGRPWGKIDNGFVFMKNIDCPEGATFPAIG
jgi:hypothetical protein